MKTARTWFALAIVAALAVGAAACSSDDAAADDPASTTSSPTTEGPLSPPDRPDGPAAVASGPLTEGGGTLLVSAQSGPDLDAAGWVEEEYAVEGTAVDYVAADGEELPTDGEWDLAPDDSADYRTRIVVRRPGEEQDFNGTVVVEWLNVSAGFDSATVYASASEEIVRGGYAWVGVSAQRIGVEGGEVLVPTPASAAAGAGRGIKALDPERYGDLVHPGDSYSYDMFTQVARALRQPGEPDVLGGLTPERLLAVGESQSAYALTSYVDGIQPLTGAFDGFLLHSRGGAATPLEVDDGGDVDLVQSIGGPATKIRTDGAAPVIVVQTETDVFGVLAYLPARQPDDERFRLWEVAGSAHADLQFLGGVEDLIDCPEPVNAGPRHFVVKAALRGLDTWVAQGVAPTEAPRLAVDDASGGALAVDGDGIGEGGVRTPLVDVPVDVLSGAPPEGAASFACLIFGTTTPLPDERIAELYPSVDDYRGDFEASTDEAVAAGFVLAEDRAALLDEAKPERIPA